MPSLAARGESRCNTSPGVRHSDRLTSQWAGGSLCHDRKPRRLRSTRSTPCASSPHPSRSPSTSAPAAAPSPWHWPPRFATRWFTAWRTRRQRSNGRSGTSVGTAKTTRTPSSPTSRMRCRSWMGRLMSSFPIRRTSQRTPYQETRKCACSTRNTRSTAAWMDWMLCARSPSLHGGCSTRAVFWCSSTANCRQTTSRSSTPPPS